MFFFVGVWIFINIYFCLFLLFSFVVDVVVELVLNERVRNGSAHYTTICRISHVVALESNEPGACLI